LRRRNAELIGLDSAVFQFLPILHYDLGHGNLGSERNHVKRPHLLPKVNGTQCGSAALCDSKLCYYHVRYHWPELDALPDNNEWRKTLPTLEDANSIQVALANVMERLIMLEIDHKTAALMLYALQTASMNLSRTSLEPALPTQVVIDREAVANRPLGASACSRVEGREYDDLSGDDTNEESDRKQPADAERLQ
jgi:hypothetical protein